jgi:hypothetical protein
MVRRGMRFLTVQTHSGASMTETLIYQIGPPTRPVSDQGREWFAVAGPAQRQSSEMAARIAFLERKVAALEAGQTRPGVP